jgi:SpoIVB peptidase S55
VRRTGRFESTVSVAVSVRPNATLRLRLTIRLYPRTCRRRLWIVNPLRHLPFIFAIRSIFATGNRWRSLLLASALVLSALAAASSAETPATGAFFPLKDVRPGLHGIGKTIFRGNQIEEFQVEILGILEGSGPQQSIILAKLTGGPLADTGVIQGMSGSPVYIDGRLVGAVALGFPFAKEAIAGIQPIEQMLADATPSGSVQPASNVRRQSVAGPGNGAGLRDFYPGATANPLLAQASFQSSSTPAVEFPFGRLRDIGTPLAMTGFTEATIRAFGGPLQKLGFEAQTGLGGGSSASASTQADPSLIVPGSMISVQLMTGDMIMSADGTVTYVDGRKIYAFGHRFLAAGSTELPFSHSEVLTVLPNLNASYKISVAKQWAGSMTSDRSTAIAGEIGRSAHLVPLSIEVRAPGNAAHHYHVQVVNDRLLTPFLTQVALFSAVDATERTLGASSIRVEGRIEFEGGLQPLVIKNVFASDLSVAMQAAANSVVPLSFALQSGFQQLKVKSASFVLEPDELKKTVQIDQIWASRRDVKAGDAIDVSILFSGENGLEVTRSAHVQIPVGAPTGTLNLTVSDANGLNFPELAGLSPVTAGSPDQLIHELSAIRPSDRAYLRVWRQEPSFPLSGTELTDPPPSVSMILARGVGPNATMFFAARGSAVAEMPVDPGNYVVSGSKTIQVEVKE